MKLTEVWFTEAQRGGEVVLYAEQIYGALFLPNNQYVTVMSVGGAAIPVVGSIKEVNEKIQAARSGQTNEPSKGEQGEK